MNATIHILNHIADTWWSWIVPAAFQAAVLACLILFVVRLGRRWPSSAKYALLLVALAKFAVPPFASAPWGLFSNIVAVVRPSTPTYLPREISSAPALENHAVSPEHETAAAGGELSPRSNLRGAVKLTPDELLSLRDVNGQTTSQLRASPNLQFSIQAWLLTVYLSGVALFAGWLMIQWRRLAGILRRSREIHPSELDRMLAECSGQFLSHPRLAIRVSDEIPTPFSASLFRPTIVLPSELFNILSPAALSAVLAHETEHHRRWDLWANAAQLALLAVWWFHPLMWMLHRAIASAREDCCDDAVLHCKLVSDHDYCDTLLQVASFGTRRSNLSSLILGMARVGHPLGGRLVRIMDATLRRDVPQPRWATGLLAIFALVVLPGLHALRAEPGSDKSTVAAQATPASRLSPNSGPSALADPKRIFGVVLDVAGQPIAGAKVWSWINGHEHPVPCVYSESGPDGRFELPTPPRNSHSQASSGDTYVVTAYKPEMGLGIFRCSRPFPDAGAKVWIDSKVHSEIMVQRPDGTPAAGIKLYCGSVETWWRDEQSGAQNREFDMLTDDVITACAVTTDTAGKAVLLGVPPTGYRSFVLTSAEFGKQTVDLGMDFSPSVTLQLRPVGSLRGRILTPPGEDPAKFRRDVFVMTNRVNAVDRFPHWFSDARVSTEKDGSFFVPAIIADRAEASPLGAEGSPWLGRSQTDILISPGRTTTVELTFEKGSTLVGNVIDRESRVPIGDVRVEIQIGNGVRRAMTNSNGVFSEFVPPGAHGGVTVHPPATYLDPHASRNGWNEHSFAMKGETLTMQPIELTRAGSLSGRVVDAAGQGRANLFVTARWNSEDKHSQIQDQTTTDAEGRFTMHAVQRAAKLDVQAWEEKVAVGSIKAMASQAEEVQIVAKPIDWVTLAGRVVDQAGKPFGDSLVRVTGSYDSGPNQVSQEQLYFGKTANDGSFQVAKKLPQSGNYEVEVVNADGRTVATTRKRSMKEPGIAQFADLVVAPQKELTAIIPAKQSSLPATDPAGGTERKERKRKDFKAIVVDDKQQPLSDVEVILWSEGRRVTQRTDKQGAVHWSQAGAIGVWITAHAEGYRWTGQFFPIATEPSRLVLTSISSPSHRPIGVTAEAQLSPAQLIDLRNSLHEFAEVIMSATNQGQKRELQEIVAMVAPDFAIELLRDPRFDIEKVNIVPRDEAAAWHQGLIYLTIVEYWLSHDLSKAEEIARQMEPGAGMKGWALNKIARKQPSTPAGRVKQMALLNEEADLARAAKSANRRIEELAIVSLAYQELGEPNEAQKLAQEAYQSLLDDPHAPRIMANATDIAEADSEQSRSDFDATLVAARLAGCNDAAWEVVFGKCKEKGYDRARCLGNIAHELAPHQPSKAAELVSQIPFSDQRQFYIPACYRMATVDLSLAESLIDSISEPPNQAYARGMLAIAIAKQDRTAAKRQLGKAYDQLFQLLVSDYSVGRSIYRPMNLTLALWKHTEQIDPDRLENYFWQTVSWRRDYCYYRGLGEDSEGVMRTSDPVLAALIARYDRELAKQILLPPDDESLSKPGQELPDFFFGSLAIVDPAAALQAITKLPLETESDRHNAVEAWRQLCSVLNHHGDDRWEMLMEKRFYCWTPDHFDGAN